MIAARNEVRLRLLVGAGLFLLTLGVRLTPAWLLKNLVSDIAIYRVMAYATRSGDNVYAYPITFPYLPYSQFLPAWALAIAERAGWSFDFAMKIPMILADACTTLLVFGYLQWRGVKWRPSVGWALAWALNPISILISAFHGNVMAIVPSLVLAAYASAEIGNTSRNRDLLLLVSALLLGLAIAMRTYPVLFLPVFLLLFTRTFKEIAVFTLVAAIPGGLSSLPYLLFARDVFLAEIFRYGGSQDFGWVAVLRDMAYIVSGRRLIDVADDLIPLTKQLFLGAYLLVCLSMPFFRRRVFGPALMIAPLLFYAFYGGISAQYLVWVLPFAVLLRDRLTLAFTVVGTTALVTFYSMHHPAILTGRFPSPLRNDDPRVWAVNAAANALLVLLSLAWAARIEVAELRSYFQNRREAPVPWLRSVQWLWSSRGYTAALLLCLAGWLTIVYRVGHRAWGLARALLAF